MGNTKVIKFDATGAPKLIGFTNSGKQAAEMLGLHCYSATVERVKGEGVAYVSSLDARARVAWNRPITTPQVV